MTRKFSLRAAHITLAIAFAFLVRLWLILTFPIVFGGDSMMRLANRNHILLSYQLPMLQLGIYLVSQLSANIIWIRLLMAALGALATLGFYLLAEDFTNQRTAFWAALLFTTNPLVLPVSIVPYQEILMLTGLLFAFHFFVKEQWTAAGLCLGLACLTRFEAWAVCPAMAFVYARSRRYAPREMIRACILFGWAPVGWLCFRAGLSPSGSYVIDHTITIWRAQRIAYLGWITLTETAIPVLFLAVIGAALLIRRGWWRAPGVQAGLIAFFCFLIAILFSAHGVSPDPERYVTSREAHIPILAVTLLAALGLMRQSRAVAAALGGLGVLLGAYGAFQFVAHETSRPEVRLGYELARYLDQNVSGSDHALIFAKPIDPEAMNMYFNKLRQAGGEQAVRAGRKALENVETSPLDYQRTLIHSSLGKLRLNCSPEPGYSYRWVAVWSDFAPEDARSRGWLQISSSQPAAVLKVGDRFVAIYHFPEPVAM
jgi:type IV secretory pathway TrbD component